ncbi:hypothetical protein G9A89_003053 [Geosiphon pyriformis]|nr:hypothetical protein G9A89_003053 [Geosiphon pyriformis]
MFFLIAICLWVALWPISFGFVVFFFSLVVWYCLCGSTCDHHGSVFDWHTFKLFVAFLNSGSSSLIHPLSLDGVNSLNIFESHDFVFVYECLSQVGTNSLLVYTDRSLSSLNTAGCRAGAAAFFKDINLGLGIGVSGLMLSTLVELQTIVLALECVFSMSSVKLFSDSQSALDVEHYHIVNVIHNKNLKVSWHKVKGYSGFLGNKCTDAIAGNASLFSWHLPSHLGKCFIMADGSVVSGNSRHFVHDIYCSVCHACCEVGFGSRFLVDSLLSEVDWLYSSLVWHPDLHMATGFTSKFSANAHTYFMKALHYQLPKTISGLFHSSLSILQLLSFCVSDSSLSMTLYKSFVFGGWFYEAIACLEIVKFVYSFSFAFRSDVWLVRAKHHAYMEKKGLILFDGSVLFLVSGLALGLLAEVVKLLGIANAFGVCFGFHKSCLFFSDIDNLVSVHIAA